MTFRPRSVIELARQSLDVALRAELFSPRLMEVIFCYLHSFLASTVANVASLGVCSSVFMEPISCGFVSLSQSINIIVLNASDSVYCMRTGIIWP